MNIEKTHNTLSIRLPLSSEVGLGMEEAARAISLRASSSRYLRGQTRPLRYRTANSRAATSAAFDGSAPVWGQSACTSEQKQNAALAFADQSAEHNEQILFSAI